jgi:hypothetical protein
MSEVREEGVSEESVNAGVKYSIPVTGYEEPRMNEESKGSGVKSQISIFVSTW